MRFAPRACAVCLALAALPCFAAAPLHLVQQDEVDLPASPVAALERPGYD